MATDKVGWDFFPPAILAGSDWCGDLGEQGSGLSDNGPAREQNIFIVL